MKIQKRAGIVCCSNGLSKDKESTLQQLTQVLEQAGVEPVYSNYIFAKSGVRSGTAEERSAALMEFYRNPEVDIIFDISGGDIANEILPYLDYDVIAKAKDRNGQPKAFWGYSDLTVVLNAIYTKTGNPGVLYQVRNMIAEGNVDRRKAFQKEIECTCVQNKKEASLKNTLQSANIRQLDGAVQSGGLYEFSYTFLQGNQLSGIVVGGNIRCLLKLAGTEYFPDMTGKVMLLEAYSGVQSRMITYLSQLKQLGVFEKISGIILGTFTEYEQHMKLDPDYQGIEQLVKEFTGTELPIVKTQQIGHGVDAKAIWIGRTISLK